MPNPLILVIDDEADLRNALRDELAGERFRVATAATGNEGLRQAAAQAPDVIVLDLRLPDMDGYDVCRSLKADARTAAIPIIMLSTRSKETEKVVGLELGADDYVAKPYSSQELLARIRVVLRRKAATAPASTAAPTETASAGTQPAIREDGVIRVDAEGRKAWVAGEEIRLTRKEFDLLVFFMERPGRAVQRSAILASVWGYEADSLQGTVDSHVKTLRKKLGLEGKRIETVTGIGYRWAGSEGPAS